MSDYKRLTTKDEEGNWQVWEDDYSHPFEALQVAIDRLADLEDKIEQGTLVELPCKVGDTIYWISSNNRDIIEAVVEKISFTKYDRVILLVEEKGVGEYNIPLVWDIFLTREEAEKHLKELKNEYKSKM